MCPPVRPIKETLEVRRERDLHEARAVGIGCVDAFPAVDEHAEDNPRPVWSRIGVRPEPSGRMTNRCPFFISEMISLPSGDHLAEAILCGSAKPNGVSCR